MIRIKNRTDFHLTHTLNCGQAFRWQEQSGWYYGVVQERGFKLFLDAETLLVESSHPEDAEQFLWRYFDFDLDLAAVLQEIDVDEHIHKAILDYRGLRILRQEPWECLASYILSQNNNVLRIQKIIRTLCRQFGRELRWSDFLDYTFPTPAALAEAGIEALQQCGTGYRASYLWEAAVKVVEGKLDLSALEHLPYERAKAELMSLKGVGEKVADCICLFSLGKYEALPIDVWMRRILERLYLHRQASLKEIRAFAQQHFGKYLGYAQQYLFHAARSARKKSERVGESFSTSEVFNRL